MTNQTKSYNALIPPSNSAYPWRPDNWQLLCYYCAQPIYETVPVAGYRQRTVYMRGKWRHKDNDEFNCDVQQLRPDHEIDDPRCHVCGTQNANEHVHHCSAVGKPRHHATPMSTKEDELTRFFGWNAK